MGPGQIFKIFVSKTKSEEMVGDSSPVSLGFLRKGCVAVGHLGRTNGK